MSTVLDDRTSAGHDAPVITVRDLYEQWAVDRGSVSEARQVADRTRYKIHIEPHFGSSPASRITSGRVQDWIAGREAAGVGPATLRATLGVLRQVLDLAVEQHLLATNPARGQRTDATAVAITQRTYEDVLSDSQVQDVVRGMEEVYRVLILLAAETGISWSEALGLQDDDVDLRHREVTVGRRLAVQTGSSVQDVPPKDGDRPRVVPISQGLAHEWALHMLLVQSIRTEYPSSPESCWVFVTKTGRRPLRSNFNNTVLRPALESAGLDAKSFTFQNFRDTAVLRMLESGVDLETVSLRIGHGAVITTRRAYSRFLKDLTQRDEKRLDDA